VENLVKLKTAIKGKKILVFGPPGCGKGNRSRDLEALGLVHVSSGIALRAKVRDTPPERKVSVINAEVSSSDVRMIISKPSKIG